MNYKYELNENYTSVDPKYKWNGLNHEITSTTARFDVQQHSVTHLLDRMGSQFVYLGYILVYFWYVFVCFQCIVGIFLVYCFWIAEEQLLRKPFVYRC